MPDLKHYVIRGGVQGRERLKILSRVMRESTVEVFERAGIAEGMTFLDVGCGSGDVTLELARRVGPKGKVVGADIDSTKLDLCRADARELNFANVEFRMVDIRESTTKAEFDVVHARFLLTHLTDPAAAVDVFHDYLKPGGLVIGSGHRFHRSLCLSRFARLSSLSRTILHSCSQPRW